jgi:hypothetical protein
MSVQQDDAETKRIADEIRSLVNQLIEKNPALRNGNRPITRALITLARTQPAVFGDEAKEIERRLSHDLALNP